MIFIVDSNDRSTNTKRTAITLPVRYAAYFGFSGRSKKSVTRIPSGSLIIPPRCPIIVRASSRYFPAVCP